MHYVAVAHVEPKPWESTESDTFSPKTNKNPLHAKLHHSNSLAKGAYMYCSIKERAQAASWPWSDIEVQREPIFSRIQVVTMLLGRYILRETAQAYEKVLCQHEEHTETRHHAN